MTIVAAAYRWEIDGKSHYAFKLNDAQGVFGNMKLVQVKIDCEGLEKVKYFGHLVGLKEPDQRGFYTLEDLMHQGRVCELVEEELVSYCALA